MLLFQQSVEAPRLRLIHLLKGLSDCVYVFETPQSLYVKTVQLPEISTARFCFVGEQLSIHGLTGLLNWMNDSVLSCLLLVVGLRHVVEPPAPTSTHDLSCLERAELNTTLALKTRLQSLQVCTVLFSGQSAD